MTLTESCLVVAIASTAMAIATPSLIRSREVYVLKSAARDVATKLHAARITAITRNADCRVRVTSVVSYAVECQHGGWDIIDRVDLPRGITITANAAPSFHRRGNVAPAATLVVGNETGRSIRIIVNLNGRVRIQ